MYCYLSLRGIHQLLKDSVEGIFEQKGKRSVAVVTPNAKAWSLRILNLKSIQVSKESIFFFLITPSNLLPVCWNCEATLEICPFKVLLKTGAASQRRCCTSAVWSAVYTYVACLQVQSNWIWLMQGHLITFWCFPCPSFCELCHFLSSTDGYRRQKQII